MNWPSVQGPAGRSLLVSAGSGLGGALLLYAGVALFELGLPWLTALALPPILLSSLACGGSCLAATRRLLTDEGKHEQPSD